MARWATILSLAALAGCTAEKRSAPDPLPTEAPAVAATASPPSQPAPPAKPGLLADRLVLAEWSKAENRARCVPLAFASDGGAGGAPRRANFSGGWAVAFDLPDRRGAYGLARTGSLPGDEADDTAARRDALLRQWPYFRKLPGLPAQSFAGYGVEGAAAYSDSDPRGLQVNSLAYVRVGGQACFYNVWSRLGRAHLELLLDNLRVVGRIAGPAR